MSGQDQGAPAKAGRAAGLRPQPASQSSRSSIPSAEDERAALIWALHFFALFARDADDFKRPKRGAYTWSQMFEDGESYEITSRIDDDMQLVGINHEETGGCYSYGLPMKLFRRAAELLDTTGSIRQYTPEQQAVFKNWLWNGGPVPSLAQVMSASGQDPKGLEAKPASAVRDSECAQPVPSPYSKGNNHG